MLWRGLLKCLEFINKVIVTRLLLSELANWAYHFPGAANLIFSQTLFQVYESILSSLISLHHHGSSCHRLGAMNISYLHKIWTCYHQHTACHEGNLSHFQRALVKPQMICLWDIACRMYTAIIQVDSWNTRHSFLQMHMDYVRGL